MTWVYAGQVSPERRYQLQNAEANQQIDALLERLRVPGETWRLESELVTTALKLFEDGAATGDLKIANNALKELRYGFKVFAPYRSVPKVTVFGSARTPVDHPVSMQARAFGARMTGAGWMTITGAGSGVMGASQEGAGRESSFGLNIRLPFEQDANPWIADDPKLITFKYFFTRKFFLVREAWAMAYFPGGFGTGDEVFESLTLMQTGKAEIVPVVLVDAPGGRYWQRWLDFVREQMVETGMVSPEDLALFRVTDSVQEAAGEVEGFYRVFHSYRFVGDSLVIRLHRAVSAATVSEISLRFSDILKGPAEQVPQALEAERGEFPELPRLVLAFNRSGFARLRQLIDFLNAA
ncbi:MAG TPA: TIGR00730 family Rossman fold protein [Candidatus Bathyarchaeia archaeon]|nr:TIGR00730 family Rossman fold protein [Candidatus Bathyarchaeia archaeon]